MYIYKRVQKKVERIVLGSVLTLVLSSFISSACFGGEGKEYPYLYNKGGLNKSSSGLALQDNESSDCLNVYFGIDGTINKRKGYSRLNTTALNSGATVTGLYYYKQKDGTDFLIAVVGDKIYKADDPVAPSFSDITSTETITPGDWIDFETFNDEMFLTNREDPPLKWTGTGNVSQAGVPEGMTDAKWVVAFKNYLFYGNVVVSGNSRPSRIYWSTLKDASAWAGDDLIEVAVGDGEEITGMIVLGERLVIFKETKVFCLVYTGDVDVPFILLNVPTGVGTVSGYTMKVLKDSITYLGADGFYIFDGLTSTKISTKIDALIQDYALIYLKNCHAGVYEDLYQYWISFTAGGTTTFNRVIVFDWFNGGFTEYQGINACCYCEFRVNGESYLYHGDYIGFINRDVYTLNDAGTAIDAYYYSKWFSFDTVALTKKPRHIYIVAEDSGDYNLTFGYNYNFLEGNFKEEQISLTLGGVLVGSGETDVDYMGGSGGILKRIDLEGQGRFFRVYFGNDNLDETFSIRGFSIYIDKGGIR